MSLESAASKPHIPFDLDYLEALVNLPDLGNDIRLEKADLRELIERERAHITQLRVFVTYARHGDLCASESRSVPCDCGYALAVEALRNYNRD